MPAERSPWPGLLGLGAPWLDSLDSRSIPGGRRQETHIASCFAWRVLLTVGSRSLVWSVSISDSTFSRSAEWKTLFILFETVSPT